MKRHLLLVTLFYFGTSCVLFAQAKKLAPLTNEVAPSSSIKALPNSAPVQAPAVAKQHVVTTGQLPLSFEANQGQTDPQVRFLSRGSGYTLFLTLTEAVLSLREPQKKPLPISRQLIAEPENVEKRNTNILRIKLVGANPTPEVRGLEELPGKTNYFIGNDPKNWRRNVPTYARAEYRAVYPGIDLVYYGDQGQLEHDFIVSPGTNPGVIRFAIAGAKKLCVDSQGNLVVRLTKGELRLLKPVVYQLQDGRKQAVEGRYVLRAKHEVGFWIGDHDVRQPLTIDPVLSYFSYLGGNSDDRGTGIAVDSSGNAYVAGLTFSPNFPTTAGVLDGTCGTDGSCNQTSDAFVAKIDPSKSGSASLVYATYLGGSAGDAGAAIALDVSGNAYVTGDAGSSDFPITANAFCSTQTTCRGAFLTKLNTDGSSLLYSTYLPQTSPTSIAVDSSGNAYVTGGTSGFLLTKPSNAFQPSFGGGLDAFVLKIDPAQSGPDSLVYSTYLGGGALDFGNGIAVDSFGNAYVTGHTFSSNFPTTATALDRTCGTDGNCNVFPAADVFVTKLNASGTGLLYSTYLGGSGQELGLGISVDAAGNAYVTGRTTSADFPVTPGAFQSSFVPSEDVFVAKIDPSQSGSASLIYATYLGGGSSVGADAGQSIAVDASGRIYVTGFTASGHFPTTTDALQSVSGGAADAFLAKVDPSQSGPASFVYSTYLGGNGNDFGNGVAVSGAGGAYVTGQTLSSDLRTTSNAFQASPPGGSFGDAFVAKISFVLAPPVTHTLTVASTNPSSGVPITVGPSDNNGQGNGTTPLMRIYNEGVVVTLGAPAIAFGNNFFDWTGCDSTSGVTCTVTINADRTVTANYAVIVGTGTINVTTNLSTATFAIVGPQSFFGTGTSFVVPNAPTGTYIVTYGAVTAFLAPSPEVGILKGGSAPRASVAFPGPQSPASPRP